MYVPDSGLLAKIDLLLKEDLNNSLYYDCKIICGDGDFTFSSLFLCATSNLIQELRYDNDLINESFSIFLPCYTKQFVELALDKLFISCDNMFSKEELDLFTILDINHQIDEKMVNIPSTFLNGGTISVQDKMEYEMENENINIIYDMEESSMPHEQLNLDDSTTTTNFSCDFSQDNNHDFITDQVGEIETQISENIIEIEVIDKSGNIEKQKSSNTNEQYLKESSEKSYKCEDCGLTLSEEDKISHERVNPTHMVKSKLKSDFLCKLCNISFGKKDLSGFRKHILTHKSQDGLFSCPICFKKSGTWGHLTQHMYKHNTNWVKPYKCTHCDYTSINRSNVIKHEAGRHRTSESQTFACQVCEKLFKTWANLSQHMKSHTDTQYSCEYCSKTFKSNNGLKHHRRLHTGDTLSCNCCNEQFLSLHAVKRHEKSIHSYDRDIPQQFNFPARIKIPQPSNTFQISLLKTPGKSRDKIGIIRGASILKKPSITYAKTLF